MSAGDSVRRYALSGERKGNGSTAPGHVVGVQGRSPSLGSPSQQSQRLAHGCVSTPASRDRELLRDAGLRAPSELLRDARIDKVNTVRGRFCMDVRYELNGDLFVWDPKKAEANWRKHGVRFEEAATVFSDPLFILVDASRNDEARDAAIGFDSTGRLLYVVHIEVLESYVRIISARRAEPEEERRYAD